MKRFLLFALFMASFTAIFSQTKKAKVTAEGIINTVKTSAPGQGTVTISQDAKMQLLLKKQLEEREKDLYVFYSGYRVQVYMGNGQKKSKDEAYAREKKMKAKLDSKMQDLTYYVSFSSPFWRLRVGDYRTYTEALVASNMIKAEFPEFSTDVMVVKDNETRDFAFEQMESKR